MGESRRIVCALPKLWTRVIDDESEVNKKQDE